MFCFLLETLDCEVLFLVTSTIFGSKEAKIRRGEDGNADFSDGFANADLNGFFLAGDTEIRGRKDGNADQPNGGHVMLMASPTRI